MPTLHIQKELCILGNHIQHQVLMKSVLLFFLAICIAFNLYSQANDSSSWHIVADEIDPDAYYGVTVANGMLGLVSSPTPLQVKEVVLNGVYDIYGRGRVSNILRTFNPVNMAIEIDGQGLNQDSLKNYLQTLDMKKASLETRFEMGQKASVKHSMMALRQLPYTSLIVIEIEAKQAVSIQTYAFIEAPDHLREVRHFYAEIDRPHVRFPLMTSLAYSPTGKHQLAASSSFIFPEPHGETPIVIHEDWDAHRHRMKFQKRLKAGESYRFALVTSSIASAHIADPFNEAERLTIFARLEGIDRLLKRHEAMWEELWKSDISLDGPLEDQRAIHSMLYHLYSFAREGTAYSLSPMGLSGLGYNGHVFWDTELWMYPPLLLLQPEIARSLLEYRFQRMEAARQNAFSHGYQGVMFPWESADDGSEQTPVWALTGPFQHHITGCVGWAFWKYYQATGDTAWLKTRGYPMLKEVAAFWTSRVERNGPGQYDINNVIGANEWQENIDNNAFTNGMAKTVLGYATQAANVLGIEPDPDWAEVAGNIPILKFGDGTTRENATYDGSVIKQADVNLLAYPLEVVTKKRDILRDLAYYQPRLSPEGPAMGASVLATLYARLGNPEKAYSIYHKSYQANEVPPFGVLAETAGGANPYFATGAGGALQAVLFGFGGLRITDEGIVQQKRQLPKVWEELKITGVSSGKKSFKVE